MVGASFFDAENAQEKNTRVGLLSLENPMITTKGLC